jgi:flagellar motor protein MotB
MADAHDKHADGAAGGKHAKGGHAHKSHGGGHEEGHEGAPEWLISFADNVALMMGFFVVLLCMNMAKESVGGGGEKGDSGITANKEETMLDFAIAVREAFNNPVDINSNDPADAALIERLKRKAGKSETRVPGVEGHEQDVQSIRPSEYYAVSGSVAFAENSADLAGTAASMAREIAAKVRGMNLAVEVRGHVSSVEAARGPEHAMTLSSQRAMAVARALAAAGVDWWQMRLVLCADHDRADAYPTSREADGENARVEIILTDDVVPEKVATRTEHGAVPRAAVSPPSATAHAE